jgi:hypothetical protein
MSGRPSPERRRATNEAIDNAVTARAGHLPIGCDHSRHLPITTDHFLIRFVHVYPCVSDRKMILPRWDVGLAGTPRIEEMPVVPRIKMMSISNLPDDLCRDKRRQAGMVLAAVIEPPL